MDNGILGETIAILVLVLANGFFALSEFSIVASRKSKLRERALSGNRGAKKAEELKKNSEQFFATMQVGITLIGALMGVFSGATIVSKFRTVFDTSTIEIVREFSQTISMAIVVLGITVLSVVVGELVPKSIALTSPERYATRVARPVTVFVRMTSFFSMFLSWVTRLLVKMLGVRKSVEDNAVSEEEINQLMLDGTERGVFDKREQSFVRSVFDFGDSPVRRAMRPRRDVIGFEKNDQPKEILRTIRESGFSRYPVYDKTIDKVIGILYAKDLIGIDVDSTEFSLDNLLREPLFVPDSMPQPQLLKEFQKGKTHLAIVLDEFGGTFGIITLEDVLEELVGEIRDEYDSEELPLVKLSDRVAFADGNVWPGDVNELLMSDLPEEQAETLAGLFIDSIGRIPEKDEIVTIEDIRMTVIEKESNRIERLKLERITPEEKD